MSGSDYKAAWLDLHERLISAAHNLERNAAKAATDGASQRLLAKRAGVNLVLSYMDEWERTGFTVVTP